jgi:hypothetical protein
MAKESKPTNVSSERSAAVSKELAVVLREKLEEKLGTLPNDVLIEFGSGPKEISDLAVLKVKTDWPDSFGRNSWYKTWAKSGADILPSEFIAARAAIKLTENE